MKVEVLNKILAVKQQILMAKTSQFTTKCKSDRVMALRKGALTVASINNDRSSGRLAKTAINNEVRDVLISRF